MRIDLRRRDGRAGERGAQDGQRGLSRVERELVIRLSHFPDAYSLREQQETAENLDDHASEG